MENQEIFAIDYSGEKQMTGIMTDEILCIFVEILTGDEILRIVKKDGSAEIIDSCPRRAHAYEDGNYIVTSDDVEEWCRRTDSYYPFPEEEADDNDH